MKSYSILKQGNTYRTIDNSGPTAQEELIYFQKQGAQLLSSNQIAQDADDAIESFKRQMTQSTVHVDPNISHEAPINRTPPPEQMAEPMYNQQKSNSAMPHQNMERSYSNFYLPNSSIAINLFAIAGWLFIMLGIFLDLINIDFANISKLTVDDLIAGIAVVICGIFMLGISQILQILSVNNRNSVQFFKDMRDQ